MLNKLRAKMLSLQFRAIRRAVIILIAKIPKDLERAITFGDALNHFLMISPFRPLFKFSIPNNIKVNVHDLTFDSPIISASFKDDVSSLLQWQLIGIGGITYKTVLKMPSKGNLRPRIQEVSHDGNYAILNSLGLPTKGVKKFLPQINNKKLTKFNRPIGISIGGNSFEEYLSVFSEIDHHLNTIDFSQFFYEINISCPNTDDGKCLSDDLESLKNLIIKFRDISSRMIVVKVSPDSTNEEVLKFCEILSNFSKTAINIGNTKYVKASDVGLSSKTFSKEGGGLSGKSLYTNTLRMVKLVASNYDLPIIATGGVSSYDNVKELLNNGASLTGMATLLVSDPFQIPLINYRLSND